MNCYRFCYHANHAQQGGEYWSTSKWNVEKMIRSIHPEATDIHIWVI